MVKRRKGEDGGKGEVLGRSILFLEDMEVLNCRSKSLPFFEDTGLN